MMSKDTRIILELQKDMERIETGISFRAGQNYSIEE